MADDVDLHQSFPATQTSSSAPLGTTSLGLYFRTQSPDDRFDYTFPGLELEKVTILSFAVEPDSVDEVELILNWDRLARNPETQLEPNRGFTRTDDEPAKQIRFKLEVPPKDHPDHVWHILDDDPGYKLQVQVRRKS